MCYVLTLAVLAGDAMVGSTAAIECTEVSTEPVDSGPSAQRSYPSAWDWTGAVPYNPVLLERFRQTAHLEGPLHRCTVRPLRGAALPAPSRV